MDSRDPIQDKFRELEYCIDSFTGRLMAINSISKEARVQNSVQGHRCDLRTALDSISDRTAEGMEKAISCGKFYNDCFQSEMQRLRARINELEDYIKALGID